MLKNKLPVIPFIQKLYKYVFFKVLMNTTFVKKNHMTQMVNENCLNIPHFSSFKINVLQICNKQLKLNQE